MKLTTLLARSIFLAVSASAFAAELPPAATHTIDFEKEIKPLFEATCIKCHAKGKAKGGLSLETREALLKGGDSGAALELGKSATSPIIEAVAAIDPDTTMPKKGTKWTPEQVGLLRAWIDQNAPWPAGISFAKPQPLNLEPRKIELAARPSVHPIDDLVGRYFAENSVDFPRSIDDRLFARRAYLDVIGLLPTPEQLDAFLADAAPDKRAKLVRSLLANRRGYADHWLTFWNDLLRNDYAGTGFIDGGRRQISGWLYNALAHNTPYDQFVAQLVNPDERSEGFIKGILWRGNVNASMTPPMQAAQNVSQVFMGVNLKCASCHDSFVNDWALADAYGLAAIYSDDPLELVHCDKPTGKKADAHFLYPQLGAIDGKAPRADRLKRLAEVITSPQNGRLPRTIVNRIWARLFGRGLVEPLDDMEKPAWSRDLLDWLAEDLVAHGYDVQHTLEAILTSHTYALPTTEGPREKEAFVFRGPLTRRLTAEQFTDALSSLGAGFGRLPNSLDFDFGTEGLKMPRWIWTSESNDLGVQRQAARAARAELAAATKQLAAATAKADAAIENGGPAFDEARKAVEQAAAAIAAAQEKLATASNRPATDSVIPEGDRHSVVFRKKFTLAAAPAKAFAVIAATQSATVQINGKVVTPIMRDGSHNNRAALLDVASALRAGENTIAIEVASHTEKPSLNDAERKQHPASAIHLNATSAVAFYLEAEASSGEVTELATDESWRARRGPEPKWNDAALNDDAWLLAVALPANAQVVDEGPGLEPIRRKDFANQPVVLGPQLAAIVSTAAHVGEIRASLLAADPLQRALDRPNREQVVPVRASAATTLQALELTNGSTLNSRVQTAAAKIVASAAKDAPRCVDTLFTKLLARPPAAAERTIALEMLGQTATTESVADLLWALLNHPEFQLIN